MYMGDNFAVGPPIPLPPSAKVSRRQLSFSFFGRGSAFKGERFESFKALDGQNKLHEHYQAPPWTLRQAVRHGFQFFVAWQGDQAIGFTCVHGKPKDGTVKTVYTHVSEQHRRQGVATQLRQALSARFPAHGLHRPGQTSEMRALAYKEKANPRKLFVNVGTPKKPVAVRVLFEEVAITDEWPPNTVRYRRLKPEEMIAQLPSSLNASQRRRARAHIRAVHRLWRASKPPLRNFRRKPK